jgi:hypothetical protein
VRRAVVLPIQAAAPGARLDRERIKQALRLFRAAGPDARCGAECLAIMLWKDGECDEYRNGIYIDGDIRD